jgi:hypothetical protein
MALPKIRYNQKFMKHPFKISLFKEMTTWWVEPEQNPPDVGILSQLFQFF